MKELIEIKTCQNCPHNKYEEDWGDIYICNVTKINIANEDFDPYEAIHSKCPLIGLQKIYTWIKE